MVMMGENQNKTPLLEKGVGHFKLARLKGFEPLTAGLEIRCSIQLSYWRIELFCPVFFPRAIIIQIRAGISSMNMWNARHFFL